MKSFMISEHVGSLSIIWLRNELRFTQKFSNSSQYLLTIHAYIHVKKSFTFGEQISVANQLFKVQVSSHLIRGICCL